MSGGFSTDGIILVSVFAFLYIMVLLLRRFQERFTTLRAQADSQNSILPDIFIIPDSSVGVAGEYGKFSDNPKHSYENLAPPTYEEVDSPRVSGSYEPPPGIVASTYVLHDDKSIMSQP